jgi:2-oxoglutarate dehydrogenase E2 component (dihydrolipoamide succinyltransferase)
MAIELKVPSVGESITEVEIGTWLKQAGDAVEKDEPIVEIESDKATVEVFAPESGTISQIVKSTGEAATIGELIGYLEPGEAKAKAKPAAQVAPRGEPEKPAEAKSVPPPKAEEKKSAPANAAEPSRKPGDAATPAAVMPAAQRLLEEHDVDAADVPATGPGGRLLKEDVQAYIDSGKAGKKAPAESREPAEPKAPRPESDREEESVRMTPLRRKAAEALVNAQQTMALLTTFNECDMSAVMEMREAYKADYEKQHGIKLGFMSFFVKAVVEALKQYPAVNAEIDGENIIYKNYYDIGIAVSGKKGLVVPVLRNAERMSFGEIELAIADMGKRARDGKVSLEELQGGTFTITNGGIFGSMMSTPIVNPPQSAILGMHAITKRPVVVKDEIVIRPMMYVALTYDHRIIDGREAVSFLVRVKECIEDPARILLEI